MATIYLTNSGKNNNCIFSFIMIEKSAIIKIHNKFLTIWLEEVFTDLITAKNETSKNTESNVLHQAGAEAQQVELHACAINKNGVNKQCTIHNVLAKTPSESGLSRVIFMIILFTNATKLQIYILHLFKVLYRQKKLNGDYSNDQIGRNIVEWI